MSSAPVFPLARWLEGTTQPDIPFNDNALRNEVLAKGALGIANSEPGSPSDGDVHVVGTAWGGFTTDDVVIYYGGTWYGFAPFDGWVKSIADEAYIYQGEWVQFGNQGGGGSVAVIAEASAFTAVPAAHAGRGRYIRAGGDVAFNTAQGYSAGEVYNIRATGSISLVGTGVTLTPPANGTLALTAGMAVTVIMTSSTAADVIGQTVAA